MADKSIDESVGVKSIITPGSFLRFHIPLITGNAFSHNLLSFHDDEMTIFALVALIKYSRAAIQFGAKIAPSLSNQSKLWFVRYS